MSGGGRDHSWDSARRYPRVAPGGSLAPDRGNAGSRLARRGGERILSRRGRRHRIGAVSPHVRGAGGVPYLGGAGVVADAVPRESDGSGNRVVPGGVAGRCSRPARRPRPRVRGRGRVARDAVDGAAAARAAGSGGAVTTPTSARRLQVCTA